MEEQNTRMFLVELLIYLVVFLFLYTLICDLYQVYVKGMPPGPWSLPVIGGMYLLNPKRPHLSLEKLYNKYGRIFSLNMASMGRVVIVMDKDLLNEIMECPHIQDRPSLPVFDLLNLGAEGLGTCRYDKRFMTMTKTFHRGIAKISKSNLETKAMYSYKQLVDVFLKNNNTDSYYPRYDLVRACSAILSSVVYGTDLENLDSEGLKTRINHHYKIMSLINPSKPMNVLPFLWRFPTFRAKLKECTQARDTLFEKTFDEHAEKYNGSIEDVIDILVDFEAKNPEKLDDISRKDMFLSAWTVYMAGCDTSTDSCLWMLLYLSVFPEVQQKMIEEIDKVTGDEEAETESVFEQKHRLNYTRAAILECLRLSSPIALGIPRTANKDLMLGGYNIPQGTTIMTTQWHMHHDENLWPEPFKLKPERFLDQEGQLFSHNHILQKMPFAPFSKGKRPCLGQFVALDLLLLFVTCLLKKATVQLPPGYKPDLSGCVLFNLRPCEFPIQCIER